MALFSLQAAVAKMCLSTSRLLSGLACVRSTRDKPSSTRFRASAAKSLRPILGSSSGIGVFGLGRRKTNSESSDFIDVAVGDLRGVFPYTSTRPDRNSQCPLYPQKRTLGLSPAMSALCQKQTFKSYALRVRGALDRMQQPLPRC